MMGPQGASLTLVGWSHLLAFGVLVPLAAIRSRKKIETIPALPPLKKHLTGVLVQLAVFAAISLWVGRVEGIPLFSPNLPSFRDLLLGAAILGAAVGAMRPVWRRAVKKRKPILRLFMPRDASERGLWIGAAAAAGFSEEVTWRGVQVALLGRLIGDPLWATAVCVLLFALAHATQGWRSVLVIIPFAAVFHGLVFVSGSLYVAMAVHGLYDIIAGLAYGRLGKEMGYSTETPAVLTERKVGQETPA